MHKKYSLVVAALLGLGTVAISHADNAAVTNKTENTTKTTTEETATQVQQPSTDMKWTELKGKVQHIDLTANTVQIKEKGTDKLIEVPVSPQIQVMDSSNHVIALGDLKEGQKIIIRHTPS